MRLRRGIIATLLLITAAVAVPVRAEAALTGCSTFATYYSNGQVGRAGHCTGWTGSGFHRWQLNVQCSNGVTQSTSYLYPTSIWYEKICPYPRIVTSYWFNYAT